MAPTEGPYRTFSTNAGTTVPWYVIPFDDQGRCKSPQTRTHLVQALQSGAFTHVFLFAHGWNNDWSDAVIRYEDFIRGFTTTREKQGIATGARYRPILVGVFWPSISLVLPWERAPQFAAAGATTSSSDADAFADEEDRSLAGIAADLPEASVGRFYELTSRNALDGPSARELAALLLPLLAPGDEGGGEPIGADDLVAAWRAGAAEMSPAGDGFGLAEERFGVAAPIPGATPKVAGGLGFLDPRHAVRMVTVWRMKDRAGTVGATGVHELLRDLLAICAASVHLVGHSYGGKVMLSALAAGTTSRPVTSVLLLQPAMSHLCFAVDADGEGHPGGYRVALSRVRQPIITTFSRRDFPLSRVFHVAVRRKSDLGERRISAAPAPPSRFAALGGYGANGLGAGEREAADIRPEGEPYPELGMDGVRVLSLDASEQITGHGDVSKPTTWWALCEQVRRG